MGLKHIIHVVHASLRATVKRLRSPHWATLERQWKEAHRLCAACNGTKRIQVHHVMPFHLYPERELDPDNLISLCMGPHECHLRIGHGGSFKAYNPCVEVDAERVRRYPGIRAAAETRAKANRQFE